MHNFDLALFILNMKISIDSTSGINQENQRPGSRSGIFIEGRDYREAPFDERWDDLYAFIDEGVGPAQLTYEAYRDTGFFMRFFRHNQDDSIFMTFQMPHAWDTSTAIHPHAHVVPMSSGSGLVKLNYAYAWFNVSTEFPDSTGWTSGSVSASYTPADQFKQTIIDFGYLTPSIQRESSILVFKVERQGSSDVSDTYSTNKTGGTAAANLGILFFDLHYQKIKAGSVDEYPEFH